MLFKVNYSELKKICQEYYILYLIDGEFYNKAEKRHQYYSKVPATILMRYRLNFKLTSKYINKYIRELFNMRIMQLTKVKQGVTAIYGDDSTWCELSGVIGFIPDEEFFKSYARLAIKKLQRITLDEYFNSKEPNAKEIKTKILSKFIKYLQELNFKIYDYHYNIVT